MSLIPLLFGAPRHRQYQNFNDNPWALATPSRYDHAQYMLDPYIDINYALADMDNAMRFVNREMGRLSGPGSGNMSMRAMSPDIVEENGQKKIQYNFDVRGFKPEDITLKTQDGRLVVMAKHEEGGDDHHVVRHFHRMVSIPEGVNLEDLKSRLSRGGVLQVEALYKPPAIEHKKEEFKEIPITHEKPKAVEQGKN